MSRLLTWATRNMPRLAKNQHNMSENVSLLSTTNNENRRGDWMETWQGIKFYPLDPRPGEVLLSDIAHHLARINRYNGACEVEHYSVAEHSVHIAAWLYTEYRNPYLAYQGLFHDAPEAYIGDMVRPLKRNMHDFVKAEELVWQAVVDAFPILASFKEGGGYELDRRVKEADNRILVDERAQVMRFSNNPWAIDHLQPLGIELYCTEPALAEASFLLAEQSLRELCNRSD